jgi:dTDP-4-dehydrorhamnose reductase
MKTVVLGAAGQLGRALCRILPGDVIAVTRSEIDITDSDGVARLLRQAAPQIVVNAAAYTQVDRAEAEPHAAFAVNALAVRDLALVCRELDAVLVHVSTNYVFGQDRLRDWPYDEDDAPGPLGVYGAGKLAGEHFVRAHWPKHFILRTSGLYGATSEMKVRGNFVDTMLQLATGSTPVRVLNDQVCTPTFVDDLANAIRELIGTEAWGLYHVTNAGACSWHEFAEAIFALAGLPTTPLPITTAEYPTAAQRPRYSVLSNRRWINAGLKPLRSWREGLRAYLSQKIVSSRFPASLAG